MSYQTRKNFVLRGLQALSFCEARQANRHDRDDYPDENPEMAHERGQEQAGKQYEQVEKRHCQTPVLVVFLGVPQVLQNLQTVRKQHVVLDVL